MEEKVRIALAQVDVALAEKPVNLEKILTRLEEASQNGAKLVVFPECALTGYGFKSAEEAIPLAESIPGPSTQALAEAAKRLKISCVLGLLEREGESLFNTAVLVGPDGLVGRYRKTHLPWLGVDRFVKKGEGPFQVYETEAGRIGILICYDLRFPEAARILALKGAEVILLPTNWPEGAEANPGFLSRSRACENRVYLIAVNRVGREDGIRFIGHSQAVDPSGSLLTEAGEREGLLYVGIEPGLSRQKRVVNSPGEYEFDIFQDRRPELYGVLTEREEPH